MVSRYSQLDEFLQPIKKGNNMLKIEFESMPLKQGTYYITMIIADGDVNNQLYHAQNKYKFKISKSRSEFGILDIKPTWDLN